MNDKNDPQHEELFEIASEQAGYFTTRQAHAAGFSSPLIHHHVRRTGRFLHIARGLYRLRDYPTTPREEVLAAWLRFAPRAVVSHDSALDILGLSDVIPATIHLTVPRAFRNVPPSFGVTVHTTTRPLTARDIVHRDGIRLTDAARTIVDVAEAGQALEQVRQAARSALARGLTTPQRLRAAAQSRGRRVRAVLENIEARP